MAWTRILLSCWLVWGSLYSGHALPATELLPFQVSVDSVAPTTAKERRIARRAARAAYLQQLRDTAKNKKSRPYLTEERLANRARTARRFAILSIFVPFLLIAVMPFTRKVCLEYIDNPDFTEGYEISQSARRIAVFVLALYLFLWVSRLF